MAASDLFPTKSRWTSYAGALRMQTLVGGIPKDADTVKAWLKSRLDLGDTEITAIAEETIEQMGWTRGAETSEELDRLVEEVMVRTAPKGNSFKAIDGELVWEGRCLKAALKEAANIAYPGSKSWPGRPADVHKSKGLKSYLEERVEIAEMYLPLGTDRPDIMGEQRIKHVAGPQGKRSAINVVDVVCNREVTFTVKVLDDCLAQQVWGELWSIVELGGVGADRARGDGRCELLKFERLG